MVFPCALPQPRPPANTKTKQPREQEEEEEEAMSAPVTNDASAAAAGDSPPSQTAPPATAAADVESAKCECCGLTEDCTAAYIRRVRERFAGKWVCGLCAEAVKDEICRSGPRPIGTEEALARHLAFCRSFRASPADADEPLISAMRQLLRRSLGSPRSGRGRPLRRMPGEVGRTPTIAG